CSRSHHGPPVADFRDGLGPGRGIYSLRDRDGADHVKQRDAAASDRHGSIDGAVPACSIFTSLQNSAQIDPSWRTLPFMTVIATLALWISCGGISKMFLSSTIRSASLPTSIEPTLLSS